MIKYKIQILVEAIPAREQEIFHYEFDIENFAFMLDRTEDAEFAADLRTRIEDTSKQLGRSNLVLEALMEQAHSHPLILAALKDKGVIR